MLFASFIFPGIIFWNSKSKCKISEVMITWILTCVCTSDLSSPNPNDLQPKPATIVYETELLAGAWGSAHFFIDSFYILKKIGRKRGKTHNLPNREIKN